MQITPKLKQLERSSNPWSLVVTNNNNVPKYISPWSEGAILQIVNWEPIYADLVIDITHQWFSDLIDTSWLIPWKWYRIIDYRTWWIYAYDQSVLWLWDVEPILVFATGISSYSSNVYSTVHPTDSIKREHLSNVVTSNWYCEWDWLWWVVSNYSPW